MTTKELSTLFARQFGFKKWPETYEVDAETYAHVCQAVFDNALAQQFPELDEAFFLKVAVGRNNGVMFKGVELLLRGRQTLMKGN